MEVTGQNFPAIEFAGKKSPDLVFSNVDWYFKNNSRQEFSYEKGSHFYQNVSLLFSLFNVTLDQ